jgi:hypothetical protein
MTLTQLPLTAVRVSFVSIAQCDALSRHFLHRSRFLRRRDALASCSIQPSLLNDPPTNAGSSGAILRGRAFLWSTDKVLLESTFALCKAYKERESGRLAQEFDRGPSRTIWGIRPAGGPDLPLLQRMIQGSRRTRRKPVVLLPGLICNERAHDNDDCDPVCS